MLPRPSALPRAEDTQTLGPKGLDSKLSLTFWTALISLVSSSESEEDNRPVLTGLLRPFNPLGPLIRGIFYLLR